jgi:hypothetical protein
LLAESDSLRLFAKERMARHEYGDVTTSEISQAYAEFCADRGWNALPSAVVERTLPDIMLDVFHVTKAHSIERDGKKSNRGWRKVRLLEVTDLPLDPPSPGGCGEACPPSSPCASNYDATSDFGAAKGAE